MTRNIEIRKVKILIIKKIIKATKMITRIIGSSMNVKLAVIVLSRVIRLKELRIINITTLKSIIFEPLVVIKIVIVKNN